MSFSRRKFVGGLGTSVAALGALGAAAGRGEAQLVYQKTDWNAGEFEKLVRSPAKVKQVYDVRAVGEGKFLNNVKNSLNGFVYGFGIAEADVKIAVALHGPANALAFSDAMWEKYRLGEFVEVNDPATGKPATRNVFFPTKAGGAGNLQNSNLQDRNSKIQNHSISALQHRGVKFLCCHTATEEQAAAMVEKFSLKAAPEEVVKDLQAHVLAGVLIVPAMVATVALLQSEGRFTYITV
jgi:intracellular sulfur oxidation DsrE/DsrF family protein